MLAAVRTLELYMPPPLATHCNPLLLHWAVLSLTVLFVTVIRSLPNMPPPAAKHVLPLAIVLQTATLPRIVSEASDKRPSLWIPPPVASQLSVEQDRLPPVMVTFETVAVTPTLMV